MNKIRFKNTFGIRGTVHETFLKQPCVSFPGKKI
jgi:hypothetical protein